MNTKLPLFILSIMILTGLSGCASTLGSPILGSWETKVLGFTQSVRFESNGTGVLVTTLGQQAFEFQVKDSDTILVKYANSDNWDEKTYTMVNNNTMQLEGLTWVRQGSV